MRCDQQEPSHPYYSMNEVSNKPYEHIFVIWMSPYIVHMFTSKIGIWPSTRSICRSSIALLSRNLSNAPVARIIISLLKGIKELIKIKCSLASRFFGSDAILRERTRCLQESGANSLPVWMKSCGVAGSWCWVSCPSFWSRVSIKFWPHISLKHTRRRDRKSVV